MPDFLIFATIVPRLGGARVVLFLFEVMPEELLEKYPNRHIGLFFNLLVFIEQSAIKYSSHCITVSQTCKEAFVKRGAPPEKVSVVLNVPDEALFVNFSVEEKNHMPGFTLITHGTLAELYGIQYIIRAVSRLVTRIPDIHLIVAGEGEYCGGAS